MQPRFSDKAVLVTGGNSGIGLASAQAFAAEGARVAVTGRDTATLRDVSESVRGLLAIRSDTSAPGEIDELMREVRAKLGRLDVLFVNAGVGAFLPIEKVTEEDWDQLMAVNLSEQGRRECARPQLRLARTARVPRGPAHSRDPMIFYTMAVART